MFLFSCKNSFILIYIFVASHHLKYDIPSLKLALFTLTIITIDPFLVFGVVFEDITKILYCVVSVM